MAYREFLDSAGVLWRVWATLPYCSLMPSDAERLRFLERFQLSVTWHDDVATIFWRGRASPGQPGGYHEVSKGKTLAEATDAAIERYNRKHDLIASNPVPIVLLDVRG